MSERTYGGYTLAELRALSSDWHVLALCDRVAALEAQCLALEERCLTLYCNLWSDYQNQTAIEWCDRLRADYPDLEAARAALEAR